MRSNTIVRKILRRLVAVGLVIVLLSAIASLGVAYVEQEQRLEALMNSIGDRELEPLSNSLWVYDLPMLEAQLTGLAREPALAYLEVRDHDGVVAASGQAPVDREPTRTFRLRREYEGSTRDLGSLRIYADRHQVLSTAFSLGLLGSLYPILGMLVAGFVLYTAFHRLVVTRVLDITAYLRSFDTEFERRSLSFHSAPADPGPYDELDEVAVAINALRDSLNTRYTQLLEANERAEQEVEEKTRELRQKVHDLEQTRAQLTEANEAKTRFLANMSHEVRTPITGVIGLSRVLSRGRLDEEQRDYARAIEDSGRSLLGIVDDLLDFSKLEDRRIVLSDDEIDPGELLSSTVKLVSHTDRGSGVPIRIEYGDGLPGLVRGDRLRLQQVLHNLLANAVKFTSGGEILVRAERAEGRAEVSAGGRPGAAVLRFSVADSGIGIPPEALPRVFESFYQVDSSYQKEFEGTGLGLAISRQLVELMGGEIHVESHPGEGSTFWFDVPTEIVGGAETDDADGPEAAGTVPWEAGEPEPGESSGDRETGSADVSRAAGPLRILVAEDNAINRMYLEKFLEGEGHEVRTAADGNAVLQATGQAEFDVILMDIQMPGVDGVEAARRIRRTSDIPIIALTAYAREEEVQSFLDAGMNAVVTKPVREAELRRTLRDFRGPGAR
ncbi:MAG: response regulator [Spirochaetes bacterium]|nr:response regulator [Spirochaetota bacterium]